MRARYQIDPALVKLAADFNPLRGIADAIEGMEKQKAENVYRNALMRRMEVESYLGHRKADNEDRALAQNTKESDARINKVAAEVGQLHANAGLTKAQAKESHARANKTNIEAGLLPHYYQNALKETGIKQQNAYTESSRVAGAISHNNERLALEKEELRIKKRQAEAEAEALKQSLKGAYQ